MTRILTAAVGTLLTIVSVEARAQYPPPLSASRLPSPLTTSHQPPLRAAPLPPDSLQSSASKPSSSPFVYSVPYGPHFTRPSGSPIIPFGSSRYYYHR